MHIYFNNKPQHTNQLDHVLRNIALLYQIEFLTDISKTWVKTNTYNNELWTLSNQSSLTKIITTHKPGTVRITNDRIRWAETVDASNTNPEIEINLKEQPLTETGRYTLIINHDQPNPDDYVNIVDKSQKQNYTNGDYETETGIRIIDAKNFIPIERFYYDPQTKKGTYTYTEGLDSAYNTNSFEQSHAMYNGTLYITENMTQQQRRHYEKNIENLAINIPRKEMKLLCLEYNQIPETRQQLILNTLNNERN